VRPRIGVPAALPFLGGAVTGVRRLVTLVGAIVGFLRGAVSLRWVRVLVSGHR
jgi:hypothetical protein